MANATISLTGSTLRDALSLAAQVMSEFDTDDFAIHAAVAGHAELTDRIADVVLAVVCAAQEQHGTLETYWERVAEANGMPLYEVAEAIARVMLDHGMQIDQASKAAAVARCLALATRRQPPARRQRAV